VLCTLSVPSRLHTRPVSDSSAPTLPAAFSINRATTADTLAVVRVLDAAMLETDINAIETALTAGDVLCVRFERTDAVVAALVITRPEPATRHIDAVAVRRSRRNRGIGSALIEAALDDAAADPRVDRVTARFDPALDGFYAARGFESVATTDGHRRGRVRVTDRVSHDGHGG